MLSLNTAYAKQKSSLKSELQSFLYSLPGHKSLYSATPLDVCRFLAWKDQNGKTQVHSQPCPLLGKKNIHPCKCPLRLSYKTVDSYVGKLRAIFRSIGRQGDWDATLGLSNPAASLPVKEYLKSVTAEQLQARVTPKQATLLFLDILVLLTRHLDRKMFSPSVTPTNLFILARDQAFFKSLFFSAETLVSFKPQKSSVFLKMTVSFLTMSGVKLFAMELLICLVSGGTRILRYAQSRPSKLISLFLLNSE